MPLSPGTSVTVRARQPSDSAALYQVISRVHVRDGYPVEGPSPSFLDPKDTLVAFTAIFHDRVVGHVLVHAPSSSLGAVAAWVSQGGDLEKTAVLGRLFVDPEARSLGLGRKLIERCREWAGERGMTLVLDVLRKDIEAIKLYEKMGWKRIYNIDGKGGVLDSSYKLGGIDWAVVYYVDTE